MADDDGLNEHMAEWEKEWMSDLRTEFHTAQLDRWNSFLESDDIAEQWHESERQAWEQYIEDDQDERESARAEEVLKYRDAAP
jgi:hypothetical protein